MQIIYVVCTEAEVLWQTAADKEDASCLKVLLVIKFLYYISKGYFL